MSNLDFPGNYYDCRYPADRTTLSKTNTADKRLMKGYMVFLNSWISIVYYMIYCGDRNYNYILAIFGA